MSSNLKIPRVCEFCNKAFIARTTKTRYCSHNCNRKHYKEKVKQEKIATNKKEVIKSLQFSHARVRPPQYHTVKEVATLLNCSVKTVYRLVKDKNIEAINLGQRMIRISKTDLDNMFN